MCISDWSSDLCSSDLPFEIADTPAGKLCRAYVEQDADKRLNALDALWTGDLRSRDGYASRILTARAAARIEPDEDLVDQASALVGSMLSARSEEHTSELQSLMRSSYAVFCLKKKKHKQHEKQRKLHTKT